jgi:DNA-directed RNA polymerase specialized sigma24 family protein
MLSGLDETEARLVRLHHLEARSYGEISRLTGMPLGSIGPALARARQKMKLQSDQPE